MPPTNQFRDGSDSRSAKIRNPEGAVGSFRAGWPGIELVVSTDDVRQPETYRIHESRHVFIVHLGGRIDKLETELDGHGGSSGPAIPGEVWSVPAQRRYASRLCGDVIQYALLCVEPAALDLIYATSLGPREIAPLAGVRDEFLHQSVKELVAALREPGDIAQLFAQTLSQAMCAYLYRTHGLGRLGTPGPEEGPTFDARTSRQLRQYVLANLSERITLDDLAAVAGMSMHHLLIAFRKAFGVSPWQYVITQR
ncbi:MAG TPA: AraC family transcriptional regulator, partial [Chthoniobacterales bacterium]